ncbi:hypothetical protein ACTMNS_08035 [Staphylococcus haemolyticus]
MSWFDDLFSNKENSDEELLRRKSKRRNGDLTQNKDDSLLPENNDIYDRPRGKFRFPIDVGQDENYEEAIYRDSNDDIGSYRLKRRTKNAKAFHDKCENAYLGCWVWG